MKLTAGLVQHCCTPSLDENLSKSIQGIKEAAERGADLVVLQELHSHLYFCQVEDNQYFKWAENIPGPTTDRFSAIAKEHNVIIVCSVFERAYANTFFNTVVVIEKDGYIAGKYRKMHIPNDPGYSERYYFNPGDLGFTPINTSIGKLGVLICWDQWFPEAARAMALAGSKLLIYPAAIGWNPIDNEDEKTRQLDSWRIIQQSHAIANCLPVVSCNRVGHETDPSQKTPGIDFWGGSFICGPQGEILSKAPSNRDLVLVYSIDTSNGDRVQNEWGFKEGRRVDAYSSLSKPSIL